MLLYGYWPDSTNFAWLDSSSEDWHRLRDTRGRRIGAAWSPPKVVKKPIRKPLGDFPSLWCETPCFSERALEVLSPLLGEMIEPLPMTIGKKVFYLINILDFVDCLNLEESKTTRNSVTGKINAVQHYVFREDALPNHHLFKIPEIRNLKVFVSSSFREKAKSAGLVGLQYMKLR